MSRRDMEHFYSISAEEKTLPTSLSDVYFQNNQWKEGVMMLLEELRDTPDHKELLLKSKQGLI